MNRSISIVIPVLHDDDALASVLSDLTCQAGVSVQMLQIIVANGGPAGACPSICARYGATYVESEAGRAGQMNAGAAQAKGDMLLFLHADSQLAPDTLKSLHDFARPGSWGSFRFRIGAEHPALRIIEVSANWRAKWLRIPYGDQGIFCSRDLFEAVGGYADTPLLEDVLLARHLNRITRPHQLPGPITTDARRWLKRGIWKTTWLNWRIMWHFYRGTHSLQELADLYRPRPPVRGN